MVAAEVPVHVKLRGGNWQAYKSTAREILLEGPTRTGKTIGILLRMVRNAQTVPGYRGLITRKVAANLGSSVLRSLEEDVFYQWDGPNRRSTLDHVHFFGGSQNEPASYEFDNGSRIVVGGMDQSTKILGSEYDEIFANQVEEFTEEDIETLITRLSHGLTPPCLITDCNPSYDRHWVLQRAIRGQMEHLKSTLKDNPAFYDDNGEMTERGKAYLESISGLTGTRYQRLVLGEWVGMENAIYADALKPEMYVELPERIGWTGRGVGGMDFGRIHYSAVLALEQAHDGRWWVRECWVGHNDKERIKDAARRHRRLFHVTSGITDPLQDWAAQDLGWKIAKSGAGSRKGRIQRVLSMLENDELRFDRNGEGVPELWEELHMYRYEVKETDTSIDDVVVRKDDDRVAALEYAVEKLDTLLISPQAVRQGQQRQQTRKTGWVST